MSVLVVLEEIEDPVLFHQTRNKVEGGFAVLDDVFALGISSLSAVLKVLKGVILEDFLDNLGDGLLLENLAVGGAREEPEPGNNFSVVTREAVVATNARESANKPIPVPLVSANVLRLDGNSLADNILKRYGVILREQIG